MMRHGIPMEVITGHLNSPELGLVQEEENFTE